MPIHITSPALPPVVGGTLAGTLAWALIMHVPPQVKKIHENEKRLEAGDHPVELLARDFEKNYNMYIFPVHWQFGQLDQHPVDG